MSVTRSQQFSRFTAFTIAASLLVSASVYARQSVTTPPAPLVNAPSTSDAALENATPAQLYNAGVTAYRAKDFAAAREMFALAAAQGKADLAARSMYNRGTTQYAASVDAMAAAQAPGASAAPTPESQQQQQQQLMESLESALRELKDTERRRVVEQVPHVALIEGDAEFLVAVTAHRDFKHQCSLLSHIERARQSHHARGHEIARLTDHRGDRKTAREQARSVDVDSKRGNLKRAHASRRYLIRNGDGSLLRRASVDDLKAV